MGAAIFCQVAVRHSAWIETKQLVLPAFALKEALILPIPELRALPRRQHALRYQVLAKPIQRCVSVAIACVTDLDRNINLRTAEQIASQSVGEEPIQFG